MDTRLTRLEVTVDHIQDDLRDLRTDLRDLRTDVGHFQTEVRTELRVVRDQAHMDFRLLFGALISAALGMAALMAKGFHWL